MSAGNFPETQLAASTLILWKRGVKRNQMARQRMIFMAAIVFSLCTLSGCMLFPAVIIPGVSPYEHAMAQTDLPALAARQDAMSMAAWVGESLGYQVSLQTEDILILLQETCEYREPVTGEYESTKIFVYRIKPARDATGLKSPDKDFEKIFAKIAPATSKEQTVWLTVYDRGVYHAGRQETVDRIMGEFKDKLLAMTAGPPPGQLP
jgi:hypothetical protein